MASNIVLLNQFIVLLHLYCFGQLSDEVDMIIFDNLLFISLTIDKDIDQSSNATATTRVV